MRIKRLVIVCCAGLFATPVFAQPGKYEVQTDKYHVSDAERAACQDDAIRICSDAFPDEDALLACMKLNRVNLTPTCRTTFEAGLRRRGIRF